MKTNNFTNKIQAHDSLEATNVVILQLLMMWQFCDIFGN